MNEMIMRMAKAMYDAYPILDENDAPISWEDLEREGDRNPCILCARAAIEAMREPTEAMVTAGNVDCWSYFGDEPFPSFERGWASAIDAALQEAPR